MARTHSFIAVYDPREIDMLRRDLRKARDTIVELMPESFRDIARQWYSCKTRSELRSWREKVVAEAVRLAKPRHEAYTREPRANCPLCLRGITVPYDRGFLIPTGLEMHLEGAGNAHLCLVTESVWAIAYDGKEEEFSRQEKIQDDDLKSKTRARRAVEVLWRVDRDEPKLDDELWFGAKRRDAESLAFAEDRLARLGLNLSVDGRITCYSKETDDYIVYGDPREIGRLQFRVFAKKLKKRGKSHHGHFYLLDSWKNDLLRKYREKLAEVVARL